jgi:hypothetical protein
VRRMLWIRAVESNLLASEELEVAHGQHDFYNAHHPLYPMEWGGFSSGTRNLR